MAVAATGFFDGVHLGHRQVLSALVEEASSGGGESLVVTFWPHPRTVLQDDARSLRLLNSLEEKKALLYSLGVDRVEVLDFTRDFSRLSAEEYLGLLKERFAVDGIVLGYDNRIGSDLLGAAQAGRVAASLGIKSKVTGPFCVGTVPVSSTKIRAALSLCLVEEAADMLGYPYMLHGVVVSGNHQGRTIGFPTANMQLYEPLKQLPGNGVYSVEVSVLGETFRGMCNIGFRPTVTGSGALTIETHIFGFDQDIYGLDIRVRFLRFIRAERRFPSLQALKEQLAKDKEECLKV